MKKMLNYKLDTVYIENKNFSIWKLVEKMLLVKFKDDECVIECFILKKCKVNDNKVINGKIRAKC